MFCNFSETVFDKKSQALSVPVADGGDRQTNNRLTNIATYRLNWPRAELRKVLERSSSTYTNPKMFLKVRMMKNYKIATKWH